MKYLYLFNKIPFLKKFLKSIIRRLIFFLKKEHISFLLGDIKLNLNIRDSIDREIFFNGYYEEEQTKFIKKKIEQYSVTHFIDIGANIGIYSLRIAKQFSHLQVFAFEPHAEAFSRFEQNIKINELEKKILIFNYALSNESGEIRFLSNERFEVEQSGGAKVSESGNTIVKQKKGDDLFNFKDQALAIKIDVEGFELNVLQGLSILMSNNKIFLQIEIFDSNFLKVSKYLENFDFRLIYKDNFTHENDVSDYFYENFSA